ncbi:hypothetical protein M885DRAFT_618919 [Pelagophyceae sp. CCMP2097]|nr:hypothetical protein M885DRAFT_618919 [Pelagophyceae sp. CCMP2097]|mmetsp:Transcript_3311/g.10032  ORF Transcript_3311/g.10032 Transcript_3311/m.10032 type:complete len:461 (+) Transcript_3311:153-1535(+)
MNVENEENEPIDAPEGSYSAVLRGALHRLKNSAAERTIAAAPKDGPAVVSQDDGDVDGAFVQVSRVQKVLEALVLVYDAVVSAPASARVKDAAKSRGTKRYFGDNGDDNRPAKRCRVTFASAELAAWDTSEAVETPKKRRTSEAFDSAPAQLENLHAALAEADVLRRELADGDAVTRAQVDELVDALKAEARKVAPGDAAQRAATFLASEIVALVDAPVVDAPEPADGADGAASTPPSRRAARGSHLAWRHAEVLSSVLRRQLKLLLNDAVTIQPGTGSVRFNFDDPAALLHRALAAIHERGGAEWPNNLVRGDGAVTFADIESAHDVVARASAHGFALAVLGHPAVDEKSKAGDAAALESLAALVRFDEKQTSLLALAELRDVRACAASLLEHAASAHAAAADAIAFIQDSAAPPAGAPPASKRAKKRARKRREVDVAEVLAASGVFLYPDIAADDAEA